MMRRVAVAVDGSEASLSAMEWAVRMVEPGGTVIGIDVKELAHLYGQYTTEAYLGAVVTDELERDWDAEAAALGQRLEELGKIHNVHTHWEVVTMDAGDGLPAAGFMRRALSLGAEALVVGQHRGFRKVEELFGSFSRYVAGHSRIPTVIVPAPDAPRMDD